GTRFRVKRERSAIGGRAPAKTEPGRDSAARARPRRRRRRRRRAPEAAPSSGGCRKAGPLQEAAVAAGFGVVERKRRRPSRKRQRRRGGGCEEVTPPRLKRRRAWGGGGAGASTNPSRGCAALERGPDVDDERQGRRGGRGVAQSRPAPEAAVASGCGAWWGVREGNNAEPRLRSSSGASLRRSAVGGVAGQQEVLSRGIRQSAIPRLQDESAVVADRDKSGGRRPSLALCALVGVRDVGEARRDLRGVLIRRWEAREAREAGWGAETGDGGGEEERGFASLRYSQTLENVIKGSFGDVAFAESSGSEDESPPSLKRRREPGTFSNVVYSHFLTFFLSIPLHNKCLSVVQGGPNTSSGANANSGSIGQCGGSCGGQGRVQPEYVYYPPGTSKFAHAAAAQAKPDAANDATSSAATAEDPVEGHSFHVVPEASASVKATAVAKDAVNQPKPDAANVATPSAAPAEDPIKPEVSSEARRP
ncbi:hypothetical protein C8R43DRAFT_1109707, partial [Mycena crocata]